MPAPRARFIVSPTAAVRFDAARKWLERQPSAAGVTVIGETLSGPHELLLREARTAGAAMGWRRTTLRLLAREIALSRLASDGRAIGDAVARDAIAARALAGLDRRKLGRLAAVSDTPGFVRAVGRAVETLRMAGITPSEIAPVDADLATFSEAVEAVWTTVGLTDRAGVFEAALSTLDDPDARPRVVGDRCLILDARIWTELEGRFVAALIGRGCELLATVPEGDDRTRRALEEAGARLDDPPSTDGAAIGAIARLHAHLFGPAPSESAADDAVTVFSAPGEGRETVEIARRLTSLAEAGTLFDRCAILLRQPEDYRPYLEEALNRAGIRPWFAGGVRRPDPAGRAFLALLRCRAEDYSALRFSEYVSIGEVPDEGEDAERVPRRWEQLLVDAAVVGSLDRWERRLAGHAAELEFKRDALEAEDGEDPRLARIDGMRANLTSLREYVLPLLSELSELPAEARWESWLAVLAPLATRSLRRPGNVLSALSDLAPMGPLGPVRLDEVLRVLTPRLLEVSEPPPANRYGRVFVGPIDAARGLAFDVVFVPGMAERLFPPKIGEDPILLDEMRRRLAPGRLPTNRDRVQQERLAFRLAVGAARKQIVLSYPRIDAMKTRPRVPSFYALEAIHAAEGRLPGFEQLQQRAEEVSDARIGWPAPKSRTQAIDEAEYDLAVLDELDRHDLRGERAVKAAGHLLHSNPHLARALRFRAYRWEVPRWTWADGLVQLSERAAEALAERSLGARPYSATALQHFAACPYRFYLQAIQGLRPREEPVGIEALDPLQRGSLVHQVQFELLTRLQAESTKERPLLPVGPENAVRVSELLEEVLEKVAGDFRDGLVPAIDRVWDDGIEAIRQDLREWLQHERDSKSPFEPWRFELSFGLPRDPNRDAHSVGEPVDLGVGLKLRGAIDLIERTPAGVLRVTDHKTGRYRAKAGATIQGGELLQPVLYALAAQTLFPDQRVESGRLYYCTADGEFRDHVVPLDDRALEAAGILSEIVSGAFAAGSFPALPREDACRWCDYRQVCGPDEELRTRSKPPPVDLRRLREYP
ncbi:PD-(D/E)XK nuclease family protein [Candidatus Palauibacter soopunensis]|uniref:PD-(D/E)XK nuclease family protein n=1 Tax=Candidatus Palauibacter soopunensis TaxID=3056739 RepID=UPI00239B5873|nr:PD-(D/E)XK nuclease family protein [Candidatus Palauibacter soopunensis]MDE2878411.1 PD-(D/E)XK nuclease family protein [Candidatus Palauibacter soopunensis]